MDDVSMDYIFERHLAHAHAFATDLEAISIVEQGSLLLRKWVVSGKF